MDNTDIIRKADLAVSDLESDGGKLSPEQAGAFIRKLIDQPTLLNTARVVQMSAPSRKINKIGFGSRIMQAAPDSGTPLTAAQRSKPKTGKVELNTEEVIAEVRLPYDVIEDNIERGSIAGEGNGGIKDTIMDLIAERAALDLEELALLGDTASTDPYLALVDGWLKQSGANVADAQGAAISKGLFKQGLQTMPTPYLRNLTALRNWVSVSQELNYRDHLSDRETVVGDNQIQGLNPTFGMGVQLARSALMPDPQGLLTFPQNLIWGVQRDIFIESDKDITAREFIIVLTARVDATVEEPDAAVQYANIG